jgi:hypothetical protein
MLRDSGASNNVTSVLECESITKLKLRCRGDLAIDQAVSPQLLTADAKVFT